jgi:hypothetical protein
MENNGGSVVAMIGKDCVAIASDLRLGNQAVGVAHNFDKVGTLQPNQTHMWLVVAEFELMKRRLPLSTISCITVSLVSLRTSTPCTYPFDSLAMSHNTYPV